MVLIPLIWGLIATCLCDTSVWQAGWDAQPDPGIREHASYDYFVAVVEDPAIIPAKLEEPMPIPNHWLFSTPKGLKKRALARVSGLRIYDTDAKTLQRRMPVIRDADLEECASSSLKQRDESQDHQKALESVMTEFGIKDPLFSDQWHLYNHDFPGRDMNVVELWRRNITGKGVTVAIVDDGLDYTHPDFAHNFFMLGSWDYNDHENLPMPKLAEDGHGTRCAGEIAAEINEECGVGIAPNAKVAGIRILSGVLTDADEARALIHKMQDNDIYSCSWGPSDNGVTIEGPKPIVKRALLHGVEDGRDGKGSIYVFASGNGFSAGDNCNYDGYTNSIYSITIAAIDENNAHPYYSESCSANMAVTYSSNAVKKITTSDKITEDGQRCTHKHTGTSAAAPIAAGVLALVLEVRPDLTWRDMQHIVREASVPFVLSDPIARGNWSETHDGRLYHPDYGYGLLDAVALVDKAKDWKLVGPQAWYFSNKNMDAVEIVDSEVAESSITVTKEDLEEANFGSLEHVNVFLNVAHERRGVLSFTLESPSGFVVELAAPRTHDISPLGIVDWTFMSVAHWGQEAVGEWKLRIKGHEGTKGSLKDWQLKLWGEAADASKAKRFSDEWDLHEPPTDVVEEAKPSSALSSSVTSGVSSSTSESSEMQSVSKVVTADVSSTSTESGATETPTLAKPSAATPSKATPSKTGQAKRPDNTFLNILFIALSVVAGGGALAMVGSFLLRRFKDRQAQKYQISLEDDDFALLDSDIELSDLSGRDSFELSGDEHGRLIPSADADAGREPETPP